MSKKTLNKQEKGTDINEYLRETTSIDYYITENIISLVLDENFIKTLKRNTILLGKTNKIGDNSINILLENGKYEFIKDFIEFDIKILDIKNRRQKNTLQILLIYPEMYEYLIEIITKLIERNPLFLNKLIKNEDIFKKNFIDNCVEIIKINTDINKVNKILEIIGYIRNFNENYNKNINFSTDILNKLCKEIDNNDYLILIIKFLDLNNLEIFPDGNDNLCFDYLVSKKDPNIWNLLETILERTTYIKFVNKENNIIFSLLYTIDPILEGNPLLKDKISNILTEIILKSNIFRIRDKYNNNFLMLLINKFNFSQESLKKLLKNNNFDLYEYNYPPNGEEKRTNIYNILLEKYGDKVVKSLDLITEKNKNYEKYFKIIRKKLISTNVGLFISNTMNNMIFTLNLLKKYKNLSIPNMEYNDTVIINELNYIETANNLNDMLGLINIYKNDYYIISNHIIIWVDENNFYLDNSLKKFIEKSLLNYNEKNNNKRFIYIKLSIIVLKNNLRHANLLIIDLEKRIIERFEPYGEIYYSSTLMIDTTLNDELAIPNNLKYISIQPYPGFQTKSNELDVKNRSQGDPDGFCLAWCFLFLELKLELEELESIEIIKIINKYIKEKFDKDFKEVKNNQENLYLTFIRYYSKRLDKEQNKKKLKYGLNRNIIYKMDLNDNDYNIVVKKINNDIKKYL